MSSIEVSENSSAGRLAHSLPARDAFFDNAKYLAIVLVAIGHSWEPLQSGSRAVDAAYMAVYTFHMPAFVLVSGYFSRRFDARPHRLRRLVTGVAVPYAVFETAYALLVRFAGDDPSNPVTLLDPWYLTWFLPALFVWRLSTPLWRTLRHALPLALVLAALASMSPEIGDDLDLQRVLQFLPFFVLGLKLRPEHLAPLRRRGVRLATLPVFAAALLVAYWAVPRMNFVWFYHDNSAQELGAPWWAGPAMTAGLLACSLTLTACFLAWVPRRRTWFSSLGTGTMYGYLLHGFLIKGALFAGFYDRPWVHGPLGEVAVTLAAGCAVTLLCTPPVRRAFRGVVEPRLSWLFRDGPRRAGDLAGQVPPARTDKRADEPANERANEHEEHGKPGGRHTRLIRPARPHARPHTRPRPRPHARPRARPHA